MLRKLNKKGQGTAEYAIVLSLVIAATLAMQTYVKRAWQGGVKGVSDGFTSSLTTMDLNGTTITLTAPSQYEPYYLQTGVASVRGSSGREDMTAGGDVARTDQEEFTKQQAGSYQNETAYNGNASKISKIQLE